MANLSHTTESELGSHLRVAPERFAAALEELLSSQRVVRHGTGDSVVYEASSFEIRVGAEQGWEAAVCDHFGAVATAIAHKLGSPRARSDDRVGGTTLRFSVHPAHPMYGEVTGLLGRVRAEVGQLWQRVHDYNRDNALPHDVEKVTFYYGQDIT